MLKWECTEIVGMGIPNPKAVVTLPITDDLWYSVCAKAKEANMNPMDWFDEAIDRANKEELDVQG